MVGTISKIANSNSNAFLNVDKLEKLFNCYELMGQVSAWQSATLLLVQTVPAWVEEPFCEPVRQSYSGDATNPFPRCP